MYAKQMMSPAKGQPLFQRKFQRKHQMNHRLFWQQKKRKKQCSGPLWTTRPPCNPSGVKRIRSNKSYVSSGIIFVLKWLEYKVGLNCFMGCINIKQMKTSSQTMVKHIKIILQKMSKTSRFIE